MHKEVGRLSSVATAIAVLLILVIAMAGLALVVVNSLYHSVWGTFIVGMAIPIVFLFITIAFGALSGFHALIASGTTPKMIRDEKDMLPIAYGAMLAEGFVAVMALIAATSLLPEDYSAINVPPDVFEKLGMQVQELPVLSQLVGEELAGSTGGGVSLAVGMAYIFEKIPFLNGLMSYLYHFIIMFEALFILTTIDAGTRVGRYLLQEAGGLIWKPLRDHNW